MPGLIIYVNAQSREEEEVHHHQEADHHHQEADHRHKVALTQTMEVDPLRFMRF